MDEQTTYWASVGLGAAALLLLIINMFTVNNDQRLSDEFRERQAVITGGSTYGQIDQSIVQALASVAVNGNDTGARSLLAAQGITIPPAAAKAEEAPKETKDTKKKSEKSDD